MQIAVLGIDLGKNSCSLVGLDQNGAVVKRRRMRPGSIAEFTRSLAKHWGGAARSSVETAVMAGERRGGVIQQARWINRVTGRNRP